MRCIFLREESHIICAAMDAAYIPSSFEIEEYCKSRRHKICPFYSHAAVIGKEPDCGEKGPKDACMNLKKTDDRAQAQSSREKTKTRNGNAIHPAEGTDSGSHALIFLWVLCDPVVNCFL